MMEYSIATLGQMGFGEIILWVFEENIKARRFYEKFGFAHDGSKQELVIGELLTAI